MKVREIEMILSEMGAIDLENPDDSLGKKGSVITIVSSSFYNYPHDKILF